jgi:hypothetical protein
MVPEFLSKLAHNENETGVLRMLVEGRRHGAPVYRKEILKGLGLEQLLQWNGISAWLTRNWRAVTGDKDANITEIRYDQARDDYEIFFATAISNEAVEELAKGLERL